ncbi:hypothetical protein BJF95_07680 [Rhizobium oryziradicis]|uniref:Uncharacterized protein n=1 Tax=Rhizobium oryziradicis TaxID=1867956 RepID=A0A1Q8ZQP6_9HYPH|nr:hypothetical protein BJF95_07680 [Rhizobium oryziradicis]
MCWIDALCGHGGEGGDHAGCQQKTGRNINEIVAAMREGSHGHHQVEAKNGVARWLDRPSPPTVEHSTGGMNRWKGDNARRLAGFQHESVLAAHGIEFAQKAVAQRRVDVQRRMFCQMIGDIGALGRKPDGDDAGTIADGPKAENHCVAAIFLPNGTKNHGYRHQLKAETLIGNAKAPREQRMPINRADKTPPIQPHGLIDLAQPKVG